MISALAGLTFCNHPWGYRGMATSAVGGLGGLPSQIDGQVHHLAIYQILDESLGSGTYGHVRLGLKLSTGDNVAVKCCDLKKDGKRKQVELEEVSSTAGWMLFVRCSSAFKKEGQSKDSEKETFGNICLHPSAPQDMSKIRSYLLGVF